jgi:succinate dehydrogenase flavin-adding protein (antitoxin of CptAB toxin-antitoxin module)
MSLKEKDLRKVTFPAPSEELTALINKYFAKRYLDKATDKTLEELENLLEEEGFDVEWLEIMYERWSQEQPDK